MTDRPSPEPPPRKAGAVELSEERFRLLVQGVGDYAIFMLDPDGYVTSWNEGARRIKGYEAEEIIGQHFTRFYPPEAIARGWPAEELEIAAREGHVEDEGWRLRKDGSPFWAYVVITALRTESGELAGFSKITRDLSERKRQEEALRESEERFRLLVEGVRDYAIFMLDPDGRVASWNDGAARIKGYQASEIIGQHFSVFYPHDAVRRGWPDHELEVARRVGRFEDEGWRIRKDGTRFYASVVITSLADAAGVHKGFAKVTRDLTERQKIEALQEEGRRTNNFLAMLGHELRNPLAPIRNAVAVLQLSHESPESKAESKVAWAAEIIERQSAHLARIVNDLLDLARVNAGKISVQRAPLDLVDLVEKTVDGMRPMVESKQQELTLTVDQAVLPVCGDSTRLAQVLVNLLSNAHRYTPTGGHIHVTLERSGGNAQLRVRDDGAGMPQALLPRVFEPFVQGERALDRSEGGLGIGLALVKRLVELHDGTVSATSEGLGLGSELMVRLPLHTQHEESPASGGPAPRMTTRHRILVVDDNVDAVESLAMLLEMWGHEVFTATDGSEGLALFAEHHPEVVLLDIGLPGMTGYEVAERLRGHDSVLVAMTGYGQPEDIARSLAAGFAHHLVKPVAAARLEDLLADVLAPPD